MRGRPDRQDTGRARRLVRFVMGGVVGFAVLGIVAVLVVRPQLIPLMQEGFPAPVWPAKGQFAVVAGAQERDTVARAGPLPEAAATLLADSDGRAMLVDRSGVRIYEAYADGFGPGDLFNSYSMVKSLVGILTVKAVAEGRIEDLETPLSDILGDNAPDISLRQLLDMNGGLSATGEPLKTDGDEAYRPFSALGRLHVFGPGAVIDDVRIDPERRGVFHYQSTNTALLGRVLETVHGAPLADVLAREIWQPAGASEAHWRRYPRGSGVAAYCCLYASATDWLRVGRFLLDNGTAEAPLLPAADWEDLFLPDLPADQRRAGVYRLHIRHDVLDREGAAASGPFAYFMGHGGQVLYLVPGSDTVVVRFGDGPQLLHSTLYAVLE